MMMMMTIGSIDESEKNEGELFFQYKKRQQQGQLQQQQALISYPSKLDFFLLLIIQVGDPQIHTHTHKQLMNETFWLTN